MVDGGHHIVGMESRGAVAPFSHFRDIMANMGAHYLGVKGHKIAR